MIEVRKVDPQKEDLRYLDGPWRNDACKGYAIMAMQRAGLDATAIQQVLFNMLCCFDDTTVEEAAEHYIKHRPTDDDEWFGIVRWAPEDVIAAASESGVDMTREDAINWWKKNESSFKNVMVEHGNRVLADMDY